MDDVADRTYLNAGQKLTTGAARTSAETTVKVSIWRYTPATIDAGNISMAVFQFVTPALYPSRRSAT